MKATSFGFTEGCDSCLIVSTLYIHRMYWEVYFPNVAGIPLELYFQHKVLHYDYLPHDCLSSYSEFHPELMMYYISVNCSRASLD